MTPTELDHRIRAVVRDIANHAPPPMLFTELAVRAELPKRSAERSVHRRPLVAASTGLALVLATAAIVWLLSDGAERRFVGDSHQSVEVTHEVIEYRATPNPANVFDIGYAWPDQNIDWQR